MKLTWIDTCIACYLTDHYTRDGQRVIGIPVGLSEADAVTELAEELLRDGDRGPFPPDMDREQAEALARSALQGVDMRWRDPATGEPVESEPPDAGEHDDVCAWFVAEWDPIDALAALMASDVENGQREQAFVRAAEYAERFGPAARSAVAVGLAAGLALATKLRTLQIAELQRYAAKKLA